MKLAIRNPFGALAESLKNLGGTENAAAIRTEASDTASHSWVTLTGMNLLAVLLPMLIPMIFVGATLSLGLPMNGTTAGALVASFLICLALQSYSIPGLANGLMRMAEGKDVPLSAALKKTDDAGRALLLFLCGILMIVLSLIPGALVLYLSKFLQGWWQLAGQIAGVLLVAGLMLFTVLRYSLSLFVLVDEPDNGVIGAMRRSAALMKGRKRTVIRAVLPLLLLAVGLTVAMALLLWPMNVRRDILTDALMYAGGAAYVIALGFMFLQIQCVLACVCVTPKK